MGTSIRQALGSPDLDLFFSARSIAVVGASTSPGKAGYQILGNLRRANFSGGVYPINPKETEILGYKCYPSLKAIPDKVTMIVVVVPAEAAPSVFQEAADRGDVKVAVIVAAGFSETQIPHRIELERQVTEIARKAGIRIIGPNCVGVINNNAQIDTTFVPNIPTGKGGLSIVTQSGALGATILLLAGDQVVPMGFSKYGHVGNGSDVLATDILEYYGKDDDTNVVGMYVEGVNDGREFMRVLSGVTAKKPVVVIKVGRTSMASQAAHSHTGSLAGSDAVYDGVIRQCGAIRVQGMVELLDAAKALEMQPLPGGPRFAIVTNAGGPGILATDYMSENPWLCQAHFSEPTQQAMRQLLPPMASVGRPDGYVDMSAAADEHQHAEAARVALQDSGVDGVILITVPPSFLSPEQLAQNIREKLAGSPKPVLLCVMAGDFVRPCRQALEAVSLPTFDTPERAVAAASVLAQRAAYVKSLAEGGGK